MRKTVAVVVGVLALVCCAIFCVSIIFSSGASEARRRATESAEAGPLLTIGNPKTYTLDYLAFLHCHPSNDVIDFCVAEENISSDRTILEDVIRRYCFRRQYNNVCSIYVWKDQSMVPASIDSITDEQSNAIIAFLLKNGSTKYDCFITYNSGKEQYKSAGCE
jgi:hypothetical protein